MQFSVNNFLFDFVSITDQSIQGQMDGHLYEFPLDFVNRKPGHPDIHFFAPRNTSVEDASSKAPFYANLEELTIANNAYRNVQFTEPQGYLQLVLMSLQPGEEIGREVHPDTTQFFRVEAGTGLAVVDDVVSGVVSGGSASGARAIKKTEYKLQNGTGLIVPAGHYHNIINTSKTEKLKLYTIYAPAHHPPGTYQQTKPLDD